MPAGYDAEVAELFRDFRAASNLTESDLAARLSTRLEVVQALEQGALYALPPWAETCRVVNNYGLLLNLDVRPLLRRIYAQVEAGIVELRPKPMPEVPFMMPPEADAPDFPMGGRPPMAPRPAPYAQPPRPNVAPRPPGQVMMADRRAQPRPPQTQSPQAQAPQMRPPQMRAPQPQPPQPQPQPTAPAAAAAKRPRPALLKWGVTALLVFGMGFGLWMLLGKPSLFGQAPSHTGSKAAPDKPLDPDDPRNRKADRLPSPNGL
jgi:hypothetical protein